MSGGIFVDSASVPIVVTKLIVDSPSAVDDGLGIVVADSAAVVKMLVVDSSAEIETTGIGVSVPGESGELADVDDSGTLGEVPSDDISGSFDVDSKFVLVASSEICSVVVLNGSWSAVLEKLKVEVCMSDESTPLDGVDCSGTSDEVTSDNIVGLSGVDSKLVLVASSGIFSVLVLNDSSSAVLEKPIVEVLSSGQSSVLDDIGGGSTISDEVASDEIVVSAGVDSTLVLVASSGFCSVLTLDGSPVEMLLVLVISPDRTGSSDEAASEDVSSPMLLLLGPSELETTALLVLSSDDVCSRALLLVESCGEVASELILLVLIVISSNEGVASD